MNSLLTNISAMSALQNLSSTQGQLSQVQNQISSGLKVANASDNAAYWSISTTMKSDTGALSAVSDALNLGSSVVGTANAAVTSVLTILNKMKDDLITAQNPSTTSTLAQIQTDIGAQSAALKSIVGSASFNGINLLDGSQSSVNFVGGFTRDSAGNTTISTIGLDVTSTELVAASGVTTSGVLEGNGLTNQTNLTSFDITTGSLANYAADIDQAISKVTTIATTVAKAQNTITTQATFVSALSDAITSGVGSLEDADMNVASTRLQALQTQQQLGIQSLSIANQNSQLILKLFG